MVYKNIKADICFNIFGYINKYSSWNIYLTVREENRHPEIQF